MLSERELMLLMRVRKRFSRPFSWTRRSFARTFFGRSVAIASPAAYSFCLVGALELAGRELGEELELTDKNTRRLIDVASTALRLEIDPRPYVGANLMTWNDLTPKKRQDVLQVIDGAISKAIKQRTKELES